MCCRRPLTKVAGSEIRAIVPILHFSADVGIFRMFIDRDSTVVVDGESQCFERLQDPRQGSAKRESIPIESLSGLRPELTSSLSSMWTIAGLANLLWKSDLRSGTF